MTVIEHRTWDEQMEFWVEYYRALEALRAGR